MRIASYSWTSKAVAKLRLDRTLIGYPDHAFGCNGSVIPEKDVDSVEEVLSAVSLVGRGLSSHRSKPRFELAIQAYQCKWNWEVLARRGLKESLEYVESAGLLILATCMETQRELIMCGVDYPVLMKELKALIAKRYPLYPQPHEGWIPE